MKKYVFPFILVIIALLLLSSVIPQSPLYYINWALFSVLIIGLALLAFFWRFERSGATSREVVFIATMGSLAALARIPFAAIVGLQPTTFIIMITGYVFGSKIGFMVGAAAALVSNFFLGQGPWTPWQMFCWGMCGVIASLLAGQGEEFKVVKFTIWAGILGFLFGWILNIWHWVGFVYPLNYETFIATYIASLPIDTVHAAGNIAFSLLFGRSFFNILARFQKKLSIEYIN